MARIRDAEFVIKAGWRYARAERIYCFEYFEFMNGIKHYYGLDVLRFVAAVLVLAFHLGGFTLQTPEFHGPVEARAWPWMAPYTQFGWVGVQIFFVISGFVIAASAYGAAPGKFLIRRAIRVFPALWVCAGIAMAIRLIWGEPFGQLLPDYLRAAVLSPVGPYIDGVVWTLVVEAVFYGGIALLLCLPRARERGIGLFEGGAFILGLASTGFLAVAAFSRFVPVELAGHDLGAVTSRYYFSVLLLRHGVLFALGMLVWVGETSGYSRRVLGGITLFAAMGAVQIGLVGGLGALSAVPVAIWALALVAAFCSLRFWREVASPRRAALLRQIGLLTYPLYLGHYTLGTYLIPMLARGFENRLVILALTLAVVFALALLVQRGPEHALQALAKRKLLPRRPAAPGALAPNKT